MNLSAQQKNTIVGHAKQKAFLEQVVEHEAFAHMYIFHGPQDVGKKRIAHAFSHALVAGRQIQWGAHESVQQQDGSGNNVTIEKAQHSQDVGMGAIIEIGEMSRGSLRDLSTDQKNKYLIGPPVHDGGDAGLDASHQSTESANGKVPGKKLAKQTVKQLGRRAVKQVVAQGKGKNPKKSISDRPDDANQSESISAELIRNIRRVLTQKHAHRAQILIIHDAHRMTTQAQNALLKIAEEPPEKTYIICVTTNIEKILPTILSRSVQVGFGLLTEDDMREEGFFTQQEEEYASYFDGRSESYKQLLSDPGHLELVKNFRKILTDVRTMPLHEKMILAQECAQDSVMAQMMLETWVHRIWSVSHERQSYQFLAITGKIEGALKDLRATNTNKKMIFENLMINL